MEFTLSSEQNAIRDGVRQYCRESYSFRSRMALAQSALGFSRDHWETFGELGWLGVALPEDVDGFGGSAVESAIILEEFGRALVLEPYVPVAVLAAQTINHCGDEARRKILPDLMNGKSILALAHREGGAWGRTHDINTSASASESCGFVLNGTKSFVLSGPAADQFLISARTSSDDRDSIALFLVNQTAPGLQQQPYRLIDGTRVCDLTLDEVAVCKDAIVATGSSVSSAIENAFEDAIVCSCAEALGAMEGALWLTVEYLKGRDQSGAPLSTYQALQHRMADMLVEVEISRSAVHLGLSALAHKDEQRRRKAISACKVQVSQSAKLVGETGVQLHGAMGLANEHRMGQYFKRLTVIAGLFGGVESHLDQFGSLNTAET